MTQIVKGHGSRPDDEETFVPVGTSLKFFSDFDVNLGTTVALAAIVDGAQAAPKETIAGTGEVGDVANYAVWQQDDGFYAKWLAMGGEEGIPIWWVGNDIPDGTRLCSAPDTCPGLGAHNCSGVLGLVQDSEIVILACRGYEDDDSPSAEYEYGSDADNPLQGVDADVDEGVDRIMELVKTDPSAAEAQVDSWPQGTMALAQNRVDFATWTVARFVKDYAEANAFDQLFGQLTANANRLSRVLDWLDDVPAYGQAVDTAATTYRETFVQWFNQASEDVQDGLRTRAAIDQLIAASISEDRTMAGVRDMLDPETAEQEEAENLAAAARLQEEPSQ
jgi:hypothetical protein